MKTTNYEISKKLQQLGFEADFDFCYSKNNPNGVWNKAHELDCWGEYNDDKFVPSYDLETILDALPASIDYENEVYHFWSWNDGMGFYPLYDKYASDSVFDMDNGVYEFSEDESLAGTAARLLIKLVEEGIINLKEEK